MMRGRLWQRPGGAALLQGRAAREHPVDFAPDQEEIQVTGVRPDWQEIPTYTQPIGPSRRPGLGGDWTPVVATSPIDRLAQWRQTCLTGDGLLPKLNF